jgi:hypothetical protein
MENGADRPGDDRGANPRSAESRVESPAEQLTTAVEAGRAVKRGDHRESAAHGGNWGKGRQLPAEILYNRLAAGPGAVTSRAAVLVGLRITGRLNLEAAELHVPLIAHRCYFDEPVNLIAATAPEISLTACVIPGVDAEGLHVRGRVDLTMSTLTILNVLGAHIQGQFVLLGATLTGGGYPLNLGDGTLRPEESLPRTTKTRALRADGLRVDEGMYCGVAEGGQRFTARGGVRLLGAHIAGSNTQQTQTKTKAV